MSKLLSHIRYSCCNAVDWVKRVRKAMELAPYIDDLHEAFEERESDAKLSRTERELLENTLSFGEITADDISIPRAEIITLKEKSSLGAVLKAFRESAHSRLPVIGRDLDDVKGLVTMKDVITALEKPDAFELKSILRPVTFVPENMPLPRVLQVMKKSRMPLVLVADEFGGTSGLATLRDIVEELVGDIDNEHTASPAAPFMPIGPGRYRVRGDCLLEEFDAAVHTRLADRFEDYVETVGGAVMQVAKTVPSKGERFTLMEGVEGVVVASDGRRIVAVDIKVLG